MKCSTINVSMSLILGLSLTLVLLWLLGGGLYPTQARGPDDYVAGVGLWAWEPGLRSNDDLPTAPDHDGATLTGRGGQEPLVSPGPETATRERVTHGLFNLPLRFIANAGQADPAVRFTVKGAGHTIFFTEEEVVFSASSSEFRVSGSVSHNRLDPASETQYPIPNIQYPISNTQLPTRNSSTVRLRFVGANPHPLIEGLSPMQGVANFFLGNDPAEWQVNVPTYGAVAYRDLYPGVDLVYRGTEGYLKSEFLVAPGADPAAIQMVYRGVEGVHLREDGALVLETGLGELIEEAPLIYQEADGVRQEVGGGYVVLSPGVGLETHRVGFQVGAYDPTRLLVIDPELSFASYLGGGDWDRAFGIAVDSEGNIYVAGETRSDDFPTGNAIDTSLGGYQDAFVTQIISAGGVYTYGCTTYLGGGGGDRAFSIAVFPSGGGAYVTGETSSNDFPTRNAIQTTLGGITDAFVTQIISVGGVYTLAYSTYLGGSGHEIGYGITVPPSGVGDAYVTGYTDSADFTTRNAVQTGYGGGSDAFVTQIISASGIYTYGHSTYLGGGGDDNGMSVAVDDDGNTYVTGVTSSADFPTRNAIQPGHQGGDADAFVTQIISAGGVYTYGYSTYLGGDGHDHGYGIAVLPGSVGHAYVTGWTDSNDFPTHNAIQASRSGSFDAFVTQIIDSGGVYTYGYATYLGGGDWDSGYDIAMDDAGDVYVTGSTESTDFPIANAIQPSHGGGYQDAFVTQIISGGGVYTYGYSTYLGGSGREDGIGVAVLPGDASDVYVTGATSSSDFPIRGGMQTVYGGGFYDAFVAKIGLSDDLALRKAVTPGVVASGQAVTYTLVYTNQGGATAIGVLITDVVPMTLTNVGFTSGGAQITPTGGVSYTWQVAPLAPDAGGVITLTGIVSPSVGGVFSLTNRATITTSDACYADENLGNNASVVYNTVDAEPPIAPTLVSPANGAVVSDTTPTLTWGDSPNAAGYLLDWNGAVMDVGGITHYTTQALVDGVYTWTVAAYDLLRNTSPYTDVWSFTVSLPGPVEYSTYLPAVLR
jgi:uncharacterized repeat protein (TIGR01451 family)